MLCFFGYKAFQAKMNNEYPQVRSIPELITVKPENLARFNTSLDTILFDLKSTALSLITLIVYLVDDEKVKLVQENYSFHGFEKVNGKIEGLVFKRFRGKVSNLIQ